jgi:deoxyribose-phosphate aldolase
MPVALHRHARRALATMDLTALGDHEDLDSIESLAAAAATPHGTPAALCVWPEWIPTVRSALDRLGLTEVRIAAVTNFPEGSADPARAARETAAAVAAGADEVDIVFPYRALLAGNAGVGEALMRECRVAAGGRCLKVILETGELASTALIDRASRIAIAGGADFIKTSTGKVPVGATLEAARTMLEAIVAHGGTCGFKAAGGIRRVVDAVPYFDLADRLLGEDWATPARFRIGASALLQDILAILGTPGDAAPSDGY